MLTAGVAGDLLVLGIFKYAGFLAANFNAMFSTGFVVNILLPVGISFYTFTQIAFLVDAYRGNVARYALPHYALFVTYFPHLIAGPILHHKDMIPQFEREETKRPDPHLILCGLIIFAHRPVQEDLPCRRHPAAASSAITRDRSVNYAGNPISKPKQALPRDGTKAVAVARCECDGSRRGHW